MANNMKNVSDKVKGLCRLLNTPRIYRMELKAARAIDRYADAHPVLSNLWIAGWVVAGMYLIFMYG